MIIGNSRAVRDREQVFAPKVAPAALDRRRLQVRIERPSAQPGKMLAAAHHAVRCQAGEKAARIIDHALRCSCRSSRAHHCGRFRQRQIQHRRQRCIEAEGLHRPRNQLAMLARISSSFFVVRRRTHHRLRGRHRRQRIAQPVHRSAFHIHAAKAVRRAQCRSRRPRASCLRASSMLRRNRMTPPGAPA